MALSWSRRKLVTTTSRIAGGAAFASLVKPTAALAQLPPPSPLQHPGAELITTTEAAPWQPGQISQPTFAWEMLNLNVTTAPTPATPGMEGFGACFNELGWTALSALRPEDRASILHELFDPTAGARFTYCRMPIGANDFSTTAYSYDEVDNDFDLKHFSIDHDRQTLIPFIHAARQHQPNLRLWASPWTPPSWMKRNHFYAEAAARPGWRDNGIRPDQLGHEGEDIFIQEPRFFTAYARYFGRFIDAYRAEGIPIAMVMPQNEFNSAQNFPSCTWTAAGLARFLQYLIPQMTERQVDVFFGTLERGNPQLLEPAMADPAVGPHLRGIGIQWAGKNALPALHQLYPQLAIFQSEQECGDGQNTWSYTAYCWQLMKLYLRAGARGYMYWNIALAEHGVSTWGWTQNSLVVVDTQARTFRYTHDFYLLKHLTHFVERGATFLPTTGTCDDALGFRNPDGTTILLIRNAEPHEQIVQVTLNDNPLSIKLPPDSINTLRLPPL